MKKHMLLLVILSAMVNQSCDSKKSLGKKEFVEKIEVESKGAIKLTDFKRIDAIENEISGVKMYGVEFEATLEMQQNSWKKGSRNLENFVVMDKLTPDWIYGVDAYFNKGDRLKMKGTINFVKKESGWKIDNILIDSQETL